MPDPRDVSVYNLLLKIVRCLVDRPDDVEIRVEWRDDGAAFFIRLAPDELGKLIGKQGRTAKALRTTIYGMGVKLHRRYLMSAE